MENPAAHRHRANEGALFTSSKCPPGPGLENSCELPFGFIWTPMSPSSGDISVVQCSGEALPPVLCLTCLAYLNMYAEFDMATGIWTCPLCGENNVAPPDEFQEGRSLSSILASPIVEYHQRIGPDTPEEDLLDSCTYVLVVDANLERDEAMAVVSAIQSFVADAHQQYSTLHLGLIVFDKVVAMYQLGLSGLASADIYTPVEANDEETLLSRKTGMERRSYLTQVQPRDDLSSLWRCLSAVFGVSVETTNESASNQAQEQNGTKASDTTNSRKEMLRRKKEARLRKQQLENCGLQHLTVESPWVAHRRQAKAGQPMRCTGEAIQCAIDLTGVGQPYPSRTSRVMLFTNGCPNLGDGSVVSTDVATPSTKSRNRPIPDVVDPVMLSRAVQYFDMTANYALENGVGIDVLCTGSNELALPAYQSLVEASGGYVLPHLSFTTPHLKHNLNFLLKHTYISRSRAEEENIDGTPHAECFVDLRVDGFVTPTHLVGPGEILPVDSGAGILENERAAFAVGASLAANNGFRTNNLPSKDMVDMSLTRIKLGRVDPLTTMSVMLLVNESFHKDDQHAFFQFTSRHVDRDGKTLFTRVATHRLPVAKNVSDFLDGVEEEVVPIVLAKGAVYRSLHGREETADSRAIPTASDNELLEKLAYDAQLDLDATIQRISGAFRLLGLERGTRSVDLTEEGGIRASRSALDFAFPPELAEAVRRLYHLRRGSLVSPGPMRSSDDRAEIRSLFLRFPLEDCISMIAPAIWSSGVVCATSPSTPSMELVPAETLALWDNCIIAADHHDSIFVWSGNNCKGPEYDDIRQNFKAFLLERSKYRFPMPELHMLSEGDSMARRFTARLAPSHADPPDHQMTHFPSLVSLSHDELEALRMKFRFYDSSSDASFRTWFWGVASATNISRNEGLSLCE